MEGRPRVKALLLPLSDSPELKGPSPAREVQLFVVHQDESTASLSPATCLWIVAGVRVSRDCVYTCMYALPVSLKGRIWLEIHFSPPGTQQH